MGDQEEAGTTSSTVEIELTGLDMNPNSTLIEKPFSQLCRCWRKEALCESTISDLYQLFYGIFPNINTGSKPLSGTGC